MRVNHFTDDPGVGNLTLARSAGPRRRRIGAACVVAALAAAAPAGAATIVVDVATDDVTPNGNCTLREAVVAANTDTVVDACSAGEAAPATDWIVLGARTYALSIDGSGEEAAATGDLDVLGPTVIVGRGPDRTTIDGSGFAQGDRLVQVGAAGFRGGAGSFRVVLRDLALVEGDLPGSSGGGGIVNSEEALLERVWITGNAAAFGGAIANAGVMTVTDSALTGNEAGFGSGAIQNSPDGTLTLRNVTVSGNTAAIGGGGIRNNGTLVLEHVTVADNTAPGASAMQLIEGSSTTFSNSIVDGACAVQQEPEVIDLGGNVESPGDPVPSKACLGREGVVDSGVLALASNGGGTPTQALSASSPAVDQAVREACPATDQRGAARPVEGDAFGGAECDAGAFERGGVPTTRLFGDGLESGSLLRWDAAVGG